MEIVLAALVAAAVAVSVALLMQRPRAAQAANGAPSSPEASERAGATGGTLNGRSDDLEDELKVRRSELTRLEERLRAKEGSMDLQAQELADRERALDDRQRNLDHAREALKDAKRDQLRELERLSGLSAGQAKQVMLRALEDDLRHESARLIRQIEEETRRDAERRARSILATVMQRVASSHAVETTVSVVELKSDELKGRIIGREGRNIRSLETLTGIDFIIDDTPGAVLLSGFDGVRREIARQTLEKLLQDGRIHPARIEEAYHQAKSEIDQHVVEVGEQAVFEANVGSLHPELVKLLGKLRFRTSYGQNVLAHSVECARLASMLAVGAGRRPARGRARRAAARHRQGGLARDGGPARARGRRAGAALQGVRGGRARDGGPPQRGRAPDRRGRDRADRRLAVRARAPVRAASRSSTT